MGSIDICVGLGRVGDGQRGCTDDHQRISTKTKLPWVTTGALHSYSEFPPMEEYAKLTAEFAKTMS